jgi:hypothetical protein
MGVLVSVDSSHTDEFAEPFAFIRPANSAEPSYEDSPVTS